MLSQVELGRPRGEVFPGYRDTALPSSQQEGGGLERPGQGPSAPEANVDGSQSWQFKLLFGPQKAAFLIVCAPPVHGTRRPLGRGRWGAASDTRICRWAWPLVGPNAFLGLLCSVPETAPTVRGLELGNATLPFAVRSHPKTVLSILQ